MFAKNWQFLEVVLKKLPSKTNWLELEISAPPAIFNGGFPNAGHAKTNNIRWI